MMTEYNNKNRRNVANTHWFHFFKNMIDNGDLSELSGNAVKVYVAIKCHISLKNNIAFPSTKTIAAAVGSSVRSVHRALRELEKKSYISIDKHKRHNVYLFKEKINVYCKSSDTKHIVEFDYHPLKIKQITESIKNHDFSRENITVVNNVNIQINNIKIDNIKINEIFNKFEKLKEYRRNEILSLFSKESKIIADDDFSRNNLFKNYNSNVYREPFARYILQNDHIDM